jgi:hypothetical protein
VTVLQTDKHLIHGVQQQNFEAREGKLVVYELLVRDFDAGRNYLN